MGFEQIADEIVVAVDVSGGEQDLTPLGAVADRLLQIELDAFPEQALAWLHAQCSADWILRIDDDEVLSASLLEQLPELTRARDVAPVLGRAAVALPRPRALARRVAMVP